MFNPVVASENIKNEFVDYITTQHFFVEKKLNKMLRDELTKTIANGPFVEVNDVFCQGLSLNQLIDQGVLCRSFRNLEKKKIEFENIPVCLPLDRPLYQHQERAIRAIVKGDNVVISTGTGSGKTNCFLIPVLNELLKEEENDTLGPGVRAMFIYPMNALANDQMKNMRLILMKYPQITFGIYNGSTEEEENAANNVYKAMFQNSDILELRDPLPNEFLSREKMKNTPPNILFTNYAMLEHLLLRPKDDVLFSNAKFKFVILDEAHVYSGATGIETALLLRRLKARISNKKQPQFILTSATLGSGKEDNPQIIQFAKNLCGVDFNERNIVRAKRESFKTIEVTKDYPSKLFLELADERNDVSKIFDKYVISYGQGKEEDLLYDFLLKTNMYALFRKKVEKIASVSTIAKKLNVEQNVAIAFISLCMRAQKNGRSLIDARYHFFVKTLEGCYISFATPKHLFLDRQLFHFDNGKKYAVFEVVTCNDCGKFALVGQIQNSKLVQINKITDKIDYFAFEEDKNEEIENEDENDNKKVKEVYKLCLHCGSVHPVSFNTECICGFNDFIKIYKLNITERGARCCSCHSGYYKRFYLGNDAATSVLATSLYEELPSKKIVKKEIVQKSNNLFLVSNSKVSKKELSNVRQFLIFSDSRQQAAKFACYLSDSYAEFLRRRGVCNVIEENTEDIIKNIYSITDFVKLLTNFFSSSKTFIKSNFDDSNNAMESRHNAWIAMLNELARFNASTSLMHLGLLQFKYLGNTADIIKILADAYHVSTETAESLLNLLFFEIVKSGAIVTENESDINDNDREYIFYSSSPKYVKKVKDPSDRGDVTNWIPREKSNKKGTFYRTNKIYYVCKALNVTEQEAKEFLENYFDYLISDQNDYKMISKGNNGCYVMPAKNIRVLIKEDPTIKWYRCNKCNKISPFNLNGRCCSVNCNGELEKISAFEEQRNNHYMKLYLNKQLFPLFVKEHTAQLGKKEGAEYQELFIKKEINALSCSTTFEMGVDVGSLETVFLRNVPPQPANYTQRAGRAGRSINAAAYALTFAKLSSHDLYFFNNPEKMIDGKVMPPLFKIDNEKIVRRHIFAVALSMFFSKFPDQYNNNDAEEFINKKGYLKFVKWINSHPEELIVILLKSIPNINNLHERMGLNDFGWINSFFDMNSPTSGNGLHPSENIFGILIDEYEHNIEEFEKWINEYSKRTEMLTLAANYAKKLRMYRKHRLIEFLARGNILPRYGFPVDTVELETAFVSKNQKQTQLCLSRDLQVAISEYAPSSEVVADGHLYKSRYIKKSIIEKNNEDWHIGYIAKCSNEECQTINFSEIPIGDEGFSCIACGEKIDKFKFIESIDPRSGFVTDGVQKEVPMSSQERVFRSEDHYIGNLKTIDDKIYNLNGINVIVSSTANDSMLVKSSVDFYVCPSCGYSLASDEFVSDKKAMKDMKKSARCIELSQGHNNFKMHKECVCKKLVRKSLHHVFKTDVAKIVFQCSTSNYEMMLSVMYALLFAISTNLNIERKDIKACLEHKRIARVWQYAIIIYDAVPGGAGHCRRLIDGGKGLLMSLFMSALNNLRKCKCEPSCYNCLRSYENQRVHDKLNRMLAIQFLEQFEQKSQNY